MNTGTQHPTITVECDTRGDKITHARLTMYPRTVFIQCGSFQGERGWVMETCEVLPLKVYPELQALHNGERWVLEEVHQMFDMSDEPELAEVG